MPLFDWHWVVWLSTISSTTFCLSFVLIVLWMRQNSIFLGAYHRYTKSQRKLFCVRFCFWFFLTLTFFVLWPRRSRQRIDVAGCWIDQHNAQRRKEDMLLSLIVNIVNESRCTAVSNWSVVQEWESSSALRRNNQIIIVEAHRNDNRTIVLFASNWNFPPSRTGSCFFPFWKVCIAGLYLHEVSDSPSLDTKGLAYLLLPTAHVNRTDPLNGADCNIWRKRTLLTIRYTPTAHNAKKFAGHHIRLLWTIRF